MQQSAQRTAHSMQAVGKRMCIQLSGPSHLQEHGNTTESKNVVTTRPRTVPSA
jgi:hypothetical protein